MASKLLFIYLELLEFLVSGWPREKPPRGGGAGREARHDASAAGSRLRGPHGGADYTARGRVGGFRGRGGRSSERLAGRG